MGSMNVLKRPGVRAAGWFLTVGLGSGALAACGNGESPPVGPTSPPASNSEAQPTASTPQEIHPYFAVTGVIANTKNKLNPNVTDGAWAHAGPRNYPRDQAKVIQDPLPEGAPVQFLCKALNRRSVDVAAQSPQDIVDKVGAVSDDWLLGQGPLPGAIKEPLVKAGASDAGGWFSAAYANVDLSKLADCRHIPE